MMEKLVILGSILMSVSSGLSIRSNQPFRHNRDVTAEEVAHDDVIMIRISNLMESLSALDGLSAYEIQSEIGNIDSFATNKLKEVANILQELKLQEEVSDTDLTLSMVTHISRLGYLIGMNMQLDESRRLTFQDVTIYVSKFEPSKFRGLYFSSNDGKDVISIPQSATFPYTNSDVMSVSFAISGVAGILSEIFNDTVGSDVIASSMLDPDGIDLTLTFSDPLFYNMKLDGVPRGKQPICGFLRNSVWQTTGCATVYNSDYVDKAVECSCDHLTIFGIIMEDKMYEPQLGVAAMIGSGFTILFCLITALVFIGYRLMNSIRCYIRFSFLTALVLAEIMYLCIGYTEAPAICSMIAASSHFFATASFAWLLSYALFIGNEIMGETEESLHVTHYTFLGWVIPFAVVLISYIWKYDHYVHDHYCWISDKHGLPYAFVLPIAFFIVTTLCVLMYDIAVYQKMKKDPKAEVALTAARSSLRSCCCILPVLSLVWLLSHFMVNIGALWLQVVFSILNITLGIMLFLIMFCFNEEVMMKRSNGSFSIKKIWSRRFATPSVRRKTPGKHPMEMTMIWRGFSARPSTSAPGQGSHPFTQSACAEGRGSDAEGQGSGSDYQESPQHVRPVRAAPIASSEDSLLTRDSVDSPAHLIEDQEQGRSSRLALLREADT